MPSPAKFTRDCPKCNRLMKYVRYDSFRKAELKNSACVHCRPQGQKFVNEEGKRYGKLVVLHRDLSFTSRPYWVCRCDCGALVTRRGSGLRFLAGNNASCPACMGFANHEAAFRLAYAYYKYGAKSRHLEFPLSLDVWKKIATAPCEYCGRAPYMLKAGDSKKGGVLLNGIDRVDNDKGYTLDNCVPCCSICNRAKSAYSRQGFLAWIDLVYLNTHKKRDGSLTLDLGL